MIDALDYLIKLLVAYHPKPVAGRGKHLKQKTLSSDASGGGSGCSSSGKDDDGGRSNSKSCVLNDKKEAQRRKRLKQKVSVYKIKPETNSNSLGKLSDWRCALRVHGAMVVAVVAETHTEITSCNVKTKAR